MDYYRQHQMPGLHAARRKYKKNMHAFLRAASPLISTNSSVCSQRVYGTFVYDVTLTRKVIADLRYRNFFYFTFRSTYPFHPRDRFGAVNER